MAGLRIVIGEDQVLLREGIAQLLQLDGHQVVAQAGDAEDLVRKAMAHRPDVVITDVQMPPTHSDDGLRAAIEIRRALPDVAVLLLSQYLDEVYADELIGDSAAGVGYLLKDRVADVDSFTDAVRRVAGGGSALDPEVVSRAMGRRRQIDPLESLTAREREVLALMAQGKSNQGIATALVISEGTVEKHVTRVFDKLGLASEPSDHRRVLAVLWFHTRCAAARRATSFRPPACFRC
jgi:DNA-binding NarL/FixJ family response regulator